MAVEAAEAACRVAEKVPVFGRLMRRGVVDRSAMKFVDQLGTLASQRNQRILDAKPRIPGLLWTGLIFGGVVLLGLGGFMRLGSTRAHRAC